MIANIVLFDPGDQAVITIDWADVLEAGIVLTAVEHTVPAPLARMSQTFNATQGLSQVKVSGAQHGGLYMIEAQATLSNGDVLNRQFPVRGWNS